jgi:hypothetical protein
VNWGCAFLDFENSGWKGLVVVTGHVYPEVDRQNIDIHFRDRAILYRNTGKGTFEDISEQAGPAILARHSARGLAIGDIDNDGTLEILANNQNEPPSLWKQSRPAAGHWLLLKLVGTRSNRSAIGARVTLSAGGRTQVDEVRSGGSYLSQNDLRLLSINSFLVDLSMWGGRPRLQRVSRPAPPTLSRRSVCGLPHKDCCNEPMTLNRRDFIVAPAATMAASLFAAEPAVPWQRKIRRVGQTNMTEHDPAVLDVEQWADYWASLKVDAVLISVTGILAFYQTKVPYHRKGKFLGGRDFFGECCAAAKKRGLHVIARMSPDLNWEDAVQAHPEWFQRDAQGNRRAPHRRPQAVPHLHVHHVHDRLHARHHAGDQLALRRGRLYTNAWPPLGALPVCYCEQCKRLPPPGTIDYWDKFNERTMYLWKLYDSIAKEKKPSNFYFGNLGGGIRSAATWCSSARSASGSSATTRDAAETIRPSGDARCKAACATPCKRARWRPT